MTPDAAGPVEAVLAEALHRAFHHAWTGVDGTHLNEPLDLYPDSRLWRAQARALAPLFAAHGAAERRAGAVEALARVEAEWRKHRLVEHPKSEPRWSCLCGEWTSDAETYTQASMRHQEHAVRAAALGDRADEAVSDA